MKHVYVLFDNTTSAMAALEYCSSHSVEGRIAPVPSKLIAGCGLAWMVKPDDKTDESVDEFLKNKTIELSELFNKEKIEYKEIICF